MSTPDTTLIERLESGAVCGQGGECTPKGKATKGFCTCQEAAEALRTQQQELGRRGEWHHPGCRKMMYDHFSSPCTCESEVNRQVAELQSQLSTQTLRIKELEAKIAEFIHDENHGESWPPEPGR